MRTFSAGKESVTESDDIISLVWSWTSNDEGFDPIEHRVTWIKGEPRMYYEVKNPAGKWVSTEIRSDRFRPTSERQAREMAAAFIGGQT